MRESIAWLVVVAVLATSACTAGEPGGTTPSNTPPPQQAPTLTPTPPESQATESTPPGPCTVNNAAGFTAYNRPSFNAQVFGQVPDDNPLPVSGLTQDGWIGFEPGVAQAGNIGLFRLRWLPPESGSLVGDCQNLPTLPTLPAQVCFTMAMGEESIHAAANEDSPLIGTLQLNAYARVVSRTPDGWLELDLSESSLGLSGPGWIPAAAANFNGPCDRFAPSTQATPIARLSAGDPVEIETIHMADQDRGWAIGGSPGADQHILRTENGGLTWSDITPPEPSSSPGSEPKQVSAHFHTSGQAQAVFWYSEPGSAPLVLSLWLTDDWGSTWQSAGLRRFSDLAEEPPLVEFNQVGVGLILVRFFVGMGNHAYALLASSDGGQNYRTLLGTQDTLDTCLRNDLVLLDDGTGWMTGSCPFMVDRGALLEASDDAGASWASIKLPDPPLSAGSSDSVLFCEAVSPQRFSQAEGLLIVRCLGPSQGYLASYLYRTSDGGQTWTIDPAPAESAYFLDPLRGWAFGHGIYWTGDGGQNWEQRKTVIWEGQFSFIDAVSGWAVARSDNEIALVRTEDGGASWSLLEPSIVSP
jgi:photosystem II stability/assembly factor-like uncharacterized protein